MAYVHEIKFYISSESGNLKAALYDKPPFFCNEFWIKNVDASDLGLTCMPDGWNFEQKYQLESLGIKPFHASKPEFNFIDKCAEAAFFAARTAANGTLLVTVQGGIKKTSNMKSHVISTKTSLDWIYTG